MYTYTAMVSASAAARAALAQAHSQNSENALDINYPIFWQIGLYMHVSPNLKDKEWSKRPVSIERDRIAVCIKIVIQPELAIGL